MHVINYNTRSREYAFHAKYFSVQKGQWNKFAEVQIRFIPNCFKQWKIKAIHDVVAEIWGCMM